MDVMGLLGAAAAPPLPGGPSPGVIALYATVVGGAWLRPAVITTAGRRPESIVLPRSPSSHGRSRAESLREARMQRMRPIRHQPTHRLSSFGALGPASQRARALARLGPFLSPEGDAHGPGQL